MTEQKVITRFPPSPTGFLHLGSVRTALFNFLFARKHGGKFILRLEDTDSERSKTEFAEDILDGLHWLGLEHDNPIIEKQSERGDVYNEYLKRLVSSGHAYISKEEVKEAGQRPEVIRFRNPNKTVSFKDLIRGEVTFDTTELGDFVIAKSMTEPVYHLAVVVDDIESGITHIIRGEDHISNTPRQILIQETLGAPRPTYAHLPLILDADRAKLSKRKHGEKVSLAYYIKQGYIRDGIINYMALLGWNPGTDKEIFKLNDLIKEFDISKVQKSGAIFNPEKLKWMNKQHMEILSPEEKYARLRELFIPREITGELLQKLTPIIFERVSTFGEAKELADAGEFDYAFTDPEYGPENLLWKGKGDIAETHSRLKKTLELIDSLDEKNFTKDAVKTAVWDYASEVGRGEILWPLRYALTGKDRSPDPFVVAELIGKNATVVRIKRAIEKTK